MSLTGPDSRMPRSSGDTEEEARAVDHSAGLDGYGPSAQQLIRPGMWSRIRSMIRLGAALGEKEKPGAPSALNFEEQLLNECGAMLRYASTRGMEIPARAASIVRRLDNKRSRAVDGWRPQPLDASELALAHRSLSRVVEPATPKSITLVNQQSPRTRWFGLFGGVFVVRVMMFLAVAFLIAFLLLLPIAGDDPVAAIGRSSADQTWGEGFLSAVYIVLAAGLGVLFSQLFRINRQITRGQYDPDEDAVHISTVVLGLISGVILAILLSDLLKDTDGSARFSLPLLALLGGFSAPAVHSIVSRLVDALGTLVGGDPRDQTAAEVQEAVTRVRTTLDQDRRRIAAKAFRIGEDAARALRIGDDARREEASEALRADIRELMIELLPEIDDEPASNA